MRPGKTLRLVRVLVIGLGVPLCIVAGSLGLQAAAFQKPDQGHLHASKALRYVLQYHLVRSTEYIQGEKPLHAICWQTWLPAPNDRPEPRAVPLSYVVISNGHRFVDFRHIVRTAGLGPLAGRLLMEYQLAGCPRTIADRLGFRLSKQLPLEAGPGFMHGEPVYVYKFGPPTGLFELFISRKTSLPLAERVVVGSLVGWSRLEPTPLDPAIVDPLRPGLWNTEIPDA